MPMLDDVALETFYAAATSEFGRIVEREGAVEQKLSFGDRGIRLSFAGSGLADLLCGSFARAREARAGAVDVTISSWEEASCPTGACRFPWREVDIAPGGLVSGSGPGHVIAVHDTYWGAITLVDPAAGAVLNRVPSRDSVPWWERAAPLRVALSLALRGAARHVVHAGAVGDDRGAVLLVGPRGSGKTTVALAAINHGLGFLADDYLLLDAGEEPAVSSIYRTLSVRTEAADGRKRVVDADAVRPAAVRGSLPVRALVAPRLGDGQARLRAVSPAAAMLAWAPTTAVQFPFDRGAVVGSLGTVARQVPCFALDLGDDPAELASAVEQALDQVAL